MDTKFENVVQTMLRHKVGS